MKGKTHFYPPVDLRTVGLCGVWTGNEHVSLRYAPLNAVRVSVCCGALLSTGITTVSIAEVMCFLLMTTETGH